MRAIPEITVSSSRRQAGSVVALVRRMKIIAPFALLVVSAALISSCGDSATSPTPPPAAADVTISIVANSGSNSFAPNPMTVTAGQTVSWKNADNDVHRIVQDSGGFATSDIAAGGTASPVTVATRGTITYHCSIHPSMTGTLVVQ